MTVKRNEAELKKSHEMTQVGESLLTHLSR